VGKIEADPRRLSRALGHLIDNAIFATPKQGRVLVEVTRHRVKGQKQDNFRVVVSDNGPGMDAATLARALDGLKLAPDGPSDRQQAVTRRQGLGLPLARQLIEAHGGTLELLSEAGQGTAAIVELP
jgi:signal transduction histidine kinase